MTSVCGNPSDPTLLTIMVTQPYGIQMTEFSTSLTACMGPVANLLKLAGGRAMSHSSVSGKVAPRSNDEA